MSSLQDYSGRKFTFTLLCCLLFLQMICSLVIFSFPYHQLYTPHFGFRASGLYENPNIIYPLAILGFFAFISKAIDLQLNWQRYYCVIAAILSFLTLILTFSRAGWIGLACGLLAIIRHLKYSKVKHILYFTAILLVISSIIVRAIHTKFLFGVDGSIQGRILIWSYALKFCKQHPLFGFGPNAFQTILYSSNSQWQQITFNWPYEPKSQILDIVLNFGLIGLILFVLFLGNNLLEANRLIYLKIAASDKAILIASISSNVSFIIAGCFDTLYFGLWDRLPVALIAFILLGWVQGISTESNRSLQCKILKKRSS